MSQNVDNMILEQLRAIRADLGELRADVTDIKADMGDVDQKVDGLAVMLTMLAGHVRHVEERLTKVEGAE